jgi:hypothetical protein
LKVCGERRRVGMPQNNPSHGRDPDCRCSAQAILNNKSLFLLGLPAGEAWGGGLG